MRHVLAALAIAACASAAMAAEAPYRLAYRANLPGDGGWDYVSFDAGRKLVFVGRPGGVLVVAAADGALLGRIGSEQGNHGAAPADDIDRVFTAEGDDAAIGVYSLSTLRRLQTIKLASEPDALLYDPARKWLLVMSREGRDVIVIDAPQARVLRTIDLGSAVEAAALDDAGQLWVYRPARAAGARGDLRGQGTARWPTAPCRTPSSLALDRVTHRLCVGGRNKVMALVDADRGTVLASAPIGGLTDSLVFDATRHLAVSANGEGFASVVPEASASSLGPVATLPTARAARTMAQDPASGTLFTVAADIASVEPLRPGQPYPVVHYVPDTFRLMAYAPR